MGAQTEDALFETWQDGSWGVTSGPSSGGEPVSLAGVSCTSSTFCAAVGTQYCPDKCAWDVRPLIDMWNGEAWSMVASPSPSYSQLFGVSCLTTSECTAVGQGKDGITLIESWNGRAWSIASSPDAAGSDTDTLRSVSCPAVTTCTAVGNYTASGEITQPLVETWNGATWSMASTRSDDGSLGGIGCAARGANCTAVGEHYGSDGGETLAGPPLAARPNGASWTLRLLAHGEPRLIGALEGVACTSSWLCVAVGYTRLRPNGGYSHPLIETMSGTNWIVDAGPEPPGFLNGVACTSSTSCVAVGYQLAKHGGGDEAIIESD